MFAGSDSTGRPRLGFALLHAGDTGVLLDPASLPGRLEAAGFAQVAVDASPRAIRFRARRGP